MSYSAMGPVAMSQPAPPDTAPETVPELCMKLQQAILRDGLIDPEEQRAIGGLMETLQQHAAQQSAMQAAGMQNGQQPGQQPATTGSGTEPAFTTEGTEALDEPDEGASWAPNY